MFFTKTSERSNGKLCFTCIPARYIFVLLSSIGLCLVFAFKSFLSVSIVAMVSSGNSSKSIGYECPMSEGYSEEESEGTGELRWTASQQAIVLEAFFYGYFLTQIPSGILTEYLSAKWMFGSGILIAGILSCLGPIAARWHFAAFFILRMGEGLVMGFVTPCMNSMVAKWMPIMERSRAVSINFAGAAIGSVIAIPLTGYLSDLTFLGGWPSIFYILGLACFVWFIFWAFFVYDSPESHPFIAKSEFEFIIEGQGNERATLSKKQSIPWIPMLTSYRFYVLLLSHFGYNWCYLTILTLLPTYYTDVLHMELSMSSYMACLPYIAVAITSCVVSYITDLIRGMGVSITFLRKINNSIAFFGIAICLVAVVVSKCNTTLNIVFFTLGMGLLGICYSGFLASYVDIAPDFAGVVIGFGQAFGNIPGFVSTTVASTYYENGQTLRNWSFVWYTCSGIIGFTQIIYLLFSTSEVQPWGKIKEV